jgi:drug/metabolite transporter (DMT)-like permease|tara:strand:- start:337 stop:543 length:207 start_codon:yes stop_codon:yes gene_type:complete
MQREKRSTGELISSLVFFFAGILLILEGKNFIVSGEHIKGYFVLLGGALSFIAAFRFQIQRFFDKWRD